jgi:hypothetical protein
VTEADDRESDDAADDHDGPDQDHEPHGLLQPLHPMWFRFHATKSWLPARPVRRR